MTEQQLDQLWQQAMKESIEAGEQFTRYRFTALVAAHAKAEERERCAKVCDEAAIPHPQEMQTDAQWAALCLAASIRALKD